MNINVNPQPERETLLAFIMAYEADELTEPEIVKGFQALLDSGLIMNLQGHYGRVASQLIEMGLCHPRQH